MVAQEAPQPVPQSGPRPEVPRREPPEVLRREQPIGPRPEPPEVLRTSWSTWLVPSHSRRRQVPFQSMGLQEERG